MLATPRLPPARNRYGRSPPRETADVAHKPSARDRPNAWAQHEARKRHPATLGKTTSSPPSECRSKGALRVHDALDRKPPARHHAVATRKDHARRLENSSGSHRGARGAKLSVHSLR